MLLSGLFLQWSTTNPLCYGAKTRIRVAAFRKTNLSSSRRAASLGSSIRCFILSGTALRGQTKTLWLLFPKALCRQGCRQAWLFFPASQKQSPKFAQMPSSGDENGEQHLKGISGPSLSSGGLGGHLGKSSAQLAMELLANAQWGLWGFHLKWGK